ncbi:MAG: pyridoxal kinase PdxY [Rhodospirillales bacterium]
MNILSIQSHVAYGYVGNRAATFPLQRLGVEVWAINTVQFSNHTGYGAWTGEVYPPAQIAALIDGIAARGVLGECDAVLSGYLGDSAMGEVVIDAATRVRKANDNALWCCDPVMGDVGRGFFVRPGIPELFRDRIVPLTDILTPNQFELDYLAGTTTSSLDDAIAACRKLLARGPRIVLVTSLHRHDAKPGEIEMLAVTKNAAYLVATPQLDFATSPNGSGDAVAALFLAHYLKNKDVAKALAEAAAAIFAVMQATHRAGRRELDLIGAQDEIARPSRHFAVRPLAQGQAA